MGNHTVDCDECGWDLRGLSGGHAPDCPTRNEGKKAEAAEKRRKVLATFDTGGRDE
jgi:hypothetical protein